MATETASRIDRWHELAQQLRVDSIRATTEAGSGHPTSSMSAADIAAVLLTDHFRYDFSNPKNPNNDHFILSKGHASPLLYSMFKAVGAIDDKELMTLRKFGSRLGGHPTTALPWVDVATGSLGQGLPIGVGIALAGKRLEQAPYRVWVLLGDSEMAEGSIWEAMGRASDDKLGNLIAIVDVNRLGQRGPTALQWNTAAYVDRARAFGWRAFEIDGHDYEQIQAALTDAERASDQPTMIVARTKKGAGVAEVENKEGWHGKALPKDLAKRAIQELGGERNVHVAVHAPPPDGHRGAPPAAKPQLPSWERGKMVATRHAFGEALRALGDARQDVVAIDAEVGNSTYTEFFEEAHPDRFFETYISEQQMISTAVGMSVRGYVPFAATFAAFMTRAFDFVRMAAVSRANIRLCGSHAGVSIGEDGPSQMALEDLAMMRAVNGSTVLYPCDANQTAQLVASMADTDGIVYLRATRAATPVLYDASDTFPVGGSKVLRQSSDDAVTIVAAGITIPEALEAYDELKKAGITARVIDAYSVKPIDLETLSRAAHETRGLIVVEDHWPQGGLGSAVLEALASTDTPIPPVHQLGVRGMPHSGTPTELLNAAGINAKHIVAAAKAAAKG
ncbi:MAG: transketolase [Chloroflexi bacterium]|nr:transketolase [Chloroflexota bacterium]